MPGLLLLSCALLAAGCRDAPLPNEEPEPNPPALGERFDPQQSGRIIGQVLWSGTIEKYLPITVGRPKPEGGVAYSHFPNPNAPTLDPKTRGVQGAVVFLERVELEQSRQWNHDPVRIEIHDEQIRVLQGDAVNRAGFVRRGDQIEMVSRDLAFHTLCARGSAFFALTFPDPDQPLRRRLTCTGLVELSSAAGKYWHRAYLFVAEHPYYTRTDEHGRFKLEHVPPGEYVVRCWHPNPKVKAQDRDPNMGFILRHHYAAPIERKQSVQVRLGFDSRAEFHLE